MEAGQRAVRRARLPSLPPQIQRQIAERPLNRAPDAKHADRQQPHVAQTADPQQ